MQRDGSPDAGGLATTDLAAAETESTATIEGGAAALDDGPPYIVSGVAIPANAETQHSNGPKIWKPAALRDVADTLADDSMSDTLLGDGQAVVDHSESARDSIGRVTKSAYIDDLGIVFEAELSDPEIARSIVNDELEVSPRTVHTDDDQLNLDDEGRRVLGDGDITRMVHLSFEQSGKSPGNSVQMGSVNDLTDGMSTNTQTLDARARRRPQLSADGDRFQQYDAMGWRAAADVARKKAMRGEPIGGSDLSSTADTAESADAARVIDHLERRGWSDEALNILRNKHGVGDVDDLAITESGGGSGPDLGAAELRERRDDAEEMGMAGAAAHYEEQLAQVSDGDESDLSASAADANTDGSEPDLGAAELRERRDTAERVGMTGMVNHYNAQLDRLSD